MTLFLFVVSKFYVFFFVRLILWIFIAVVCVSKCVLIFITYKQNSAIGCIRMNVLTGDIVIQSDAVYEKLIVHRLVFELTQTNMLNRFRFR